MQQRRIQRRLLRQPRFVGPNFVGLGLALLLLVAVAITSYSSWSEYLIAADEVRAIRATINDLKDLVFYVQAAESGQRGFLLTRNSSYLDSYSAAIPEVHARLNALAQSAAVRERHPASVGQLRQKVVTKLEELKTTVELARAGSTAAALGLVNTNRGKATMDQVRALEQSIERDLDFHLSTTQRKSRRFARISQLTSTFGSAGIFVIVLISAIEIHRLISARQRLNVDLARSAADFRYLADSVPQLVWQIGERGVFEYVNERWTDFSGLPLHQMSSPAWEHLLHPADRSSFLRKWKTSMEAHEPFSGECRLRDRSTGRYCWFLFRATPVAAEESGTVRWFATYTNIDQQKATAQALQRTNEDLQQFVYSASHDLQEPLRTLMVYADLITKRGTRPMDDKDEQYLRLLRESAERMRMLVSDLLTYTEVVSSTGDRDVHAEASRVLEKVLHNLQGTISECGAQIHYGELPALAVSEVHLLQIFQNLLSNALKYRQAGVTPRIEIGARRESGEWLISVKDNGIGIDPAYHQKIFGIFKRLHPAHEYPGTGLGLAICKKIVERNHGRIWVESQAGAGATFYFSLPAASIEPVATPEQAHPQHR
ncbi:MAG TPA: ATP-binding protein [Bryobacteraceae bacterium]|nr:ATP-binding protein [Bryobacteraceae bacterium]